MKQDLESIHKFEETINFLLSKNNDFSSWKEKKQFRYILNYLALLYSYKPFQDDIEALRKEIGITNNGLSYEEQRDIYLKSLVNPNNAKKKIIFNNFAFINHCFSQSLNDYISKIKDKEEANRAISLAISKIINKYRLTKYLDIFFKEILLFGIINIIPQITSYEITSNTSFNNILKYPSIIVSFNDIPSTQEILRLREKLKNIFNKKNYFSSFEHKKMTRNTSELYNLIMSDYYNSLGWDNLKIARKLWPNPDYSANVRVQQITNMDAKTSKFREEREKLILCK